MHHRNRSRGRRFVGCGRWPRCIRLSRARGRRTCCSLVLARLTVTVPGSTAVLPGSAGAVSAGTTIGACAGGDTAGGRSPASLGPGEGGAPLSAASGAGWRVGCSVAWAAGGTMGGATMGCVDAGGVCGSSAR